MWVDYRALLTHPWVVRPGSEGRGPPKESLARAMRASGNLNPKAIRVSRRILVLVDSIRALGRACSRWRRSGYVPPRGVTPEFDT